MPRTQQARTVHQPRRPLAFQGKAKHRESISHPAIVAPDDLTERDQWVLWRHEKRTAASDPTKLPYQPTGKHASSADPSTWTSFERVIDCFRRTGKCYSGVGFVFSVSDPFVGVDLDDCLEADGTVKPWARAVVERFADSYSEISPSGYGVKIWARGAIPVNLPGVKVGDGQIEMYSNRRYFAVTGNVFRGAPLQVEDHAADLLTLYENLTCKRTKGTGRSDRSMVAESPMDSNTARSSRSEGRSVPGESVTKQSGPVFK
jgi:primase-polymerase (primpol)-like protein